MLFRLHQSGPASVSVVLAQKVHYVFVVSLRRQLQGSIASVVSWAGIRLGGQQQLRYIHVVVERRQMKGCIALLVFGIDVGLAGKQQTHHILFPLARGQVQRRIAIVVLDVDLCLVGKQQLCDICVAVNSRQVQQMVLDSKAVKAAGGQPELTLGVLLQFLGLLERLRRLFAVC